NGLTDAEWYGDLHAHAADIDQTKWIGPNFAADLETRIIEPGRSASAAVAASSYLTALYTIISPEEMKEDPTFNERSDLDAAVSNNHLAALDVTCDGDRIISLPQGYAINLFGSTTWPKMPTDMPWAERIYTVGATGDPVTLADNHDAIARSLHGSSLGG